MPNSEKKLIPQATEISARKCPDSRAVIKPSNQATTPTSTSPASSPRKGECPPMLSSAVAYAPRPTKLACPNEVWPLIPVSSTRPSATIPAMPT